MTAVDGTCGFIHEIQTGEYGYPRLFKRYTSEIIPALVDVGGGSNRSHVLRGTGLA